MTPAGLGVVAIVGAILCAGAGVALLTHAVTRCYTRPIKAVS